MQRKHRENSWGFAAFSGRRDLARSGLPGLRGENRRSHMSMRKSLAATVAVLVLGLATPALAQNGGNNGDSNINNFLRQSPDGMRPTTNGIPRIVDNREGQPVIQYQGARGPGVQDGGTPRIVDNREGQPVIRYGSGPDAGDTTDSSGQQALASRHGMRSDATPVMASRQVTPLLQKARASLRAGRNGAAVAALEEAETQLLNHGGDGNYQTVRSVSEARVAAQSGNRGAALRSLDMVMQQMASAN
jgi:hypothetical protein